MKPPRNKRLMSTAKILKRYGWTRPLIKAMLVPERIEEWAPRCPPKRLYNPTHVWEVEQSADFAAALSESALRASRASSVGPKPPLEQEAIVKEVQGWTIEIDAWPMAQILAVLGAPPLSPPVRTPLPGEVLWRAADWRVLAFIRDKLTNYDVLASALNERSGRGMPQARKRLRERVLLAIASAYPELEGVSKQAIERRFRSVPPAKREI